MMKNIPINDLEYVQNHCDQLPIDGETVFPIHDNKWVDRRFCEYEVDGTTYYVVVYAIMDNIDEMLHWEDGYMSQNFEEMRAYYASLFNDLGGILEQ